ncbi:hypothetical protein SAMN05446635_0478 [Burkholderia sp. OK233]|nr:hypothetical protein SAMN05446635_0478 [Burkholderia sp. OK233]
MTKELTVELDGETFSRRYRVLGKTVVVYYLDATKYANSGPTLPEIFARWMLKDLVRGKKTQALMWPPRLAIVSAACLVLRETTHEA